MACFWSLPEAVRAREGANVTPAEEAVGVRRAAVAGAQPFGLSSGSGVTGRRVLVLVLTAVACPAYMTNMLVRHTGKRLLEKHMARSKGAAYADYVRRTSGFIPWPPN